MDGEESWHLKLCLSAIFFNGVIVRRSNKITVSDINDVTDTLILPVSSADPYSAYQCIYIHALKLGCESLYVGNLRAGQTLHVSHSVA